MQSVLRISARAISILPALLKEFEKLIYNRLYLIGDEPIKLLYF